MDCGAVQIILEKIRAPTDLGGLIRASTVYFINTLLPWNLHYTFEYLFGLYLVGCTMIFQTLRFGNRYSSALNDHSKPPSTLR